MDKSNIIFIAIAFAAFGAFLYKKFIRKDQDKSYRRKTPDSSIPSHTTAKDDDYEPYMKK
jgi:hypothetical protein